MNNTLLKTARLSTALALTLSTAGPRPVRAQIAPALAAVQSVALQTDVDGDGQADPGDTLRYTLVVSNTGGADAQAVTLTEALDANTTLTGPAQATPLALGDIYTASNALALTVAAGAGLLANDFGLPAPTVTAQSAQSTTAGGSVSVAASGAFTYTAPSGYTGGDSFSYAIANASGADTGTVSLQVFAPPQAVADGYATVQDTPLTIAAGSGLLVNDTLAGGALTAYAAASSEGGSVAVGSDGGFIYTPPAGFFSPPIDTFTYTLSNPVGQSTATVTLTVDLPGPPLAVGDSYTATANARLTVSAAGVLANDTRNSATISASATTSAQGGTIALAADGGFTYDPPTDFISPPTDTFTYTLSNALGESTATVTLNVRPPGAPLVIDDAYTTTANTQLSVPALTGLLANDTPNLAVIDAYAATTARGGGVVLASTGAFTYTPPSDTISPPTDSFTYTLTNALGSATGTVTLTIDPPGAPTAADDAYVATAEVELSVDAPSGAFANDTLNFAALAGYAATTSRGGSVTLAPTGAFTYTPPAGTVSPPVDSFTYTVENPLGAATATVRITLNPPGAPLTIADGYTATVNTNLIIAGPGVLANDTVNFGTLTDYATTTTRGGGIVLAPTGAFTYTPPSDTVSPPTDSFTYTVSNVLGESTATVTLTIAPPAAPEADADAYTAVANTDLVVAAGAGVLANDTPNWGALDAYAATTARGGSVVLAPTGAFTYTPPADTISPPTDSFTYTLSNLLGASTATVTLTIDPPAPPLAVAETYTATVNVPYSVAAPGVLANDTLNFGALTDYATISGAGGGVLLAPSGAFTYTSATDVLGTDTYTYTLSNSLGSSTATVTVNVLPPPPVAAADAYTTTGNVDLTVPAPGGVLNNDTLNWATLTASATTSAQGGAVSVSADGGFSYSPATGFTGTDTFTYTLGNAAATSTATVTVTVSERVWFVDNTAAAGGDGRHSAPFDTLAEAEAASTANDILYVYYGDGTSTGQNAGITLKAGQRLLGQHVALVVNGATIEPAVPGSRPVVTTASGNTITAPAATGVEVRGLALRGGSTGDLVALTTSGTSNAGLTLSDCTLTASGNSGVDITQASTGALTLSLSDLAFSGGGPALRVARSSGTATLTAFEDLTFDGAVTGDAVQLTGVVFDATPGGAFNTVTGAVTIGSGGNGVGGGGLLLTGVSGDLALPTLVIDADGGSGLSATGTTAYTGSAGFRLTANTGAAVIAANGGPAVSADQVTLDLILNTLTSTNSPSTGVSLTTVAGTFTTGAGSAITNAASTDFYVSGGSGAVTYAGTIVNTAGRSVWVLNRTSGSVTFSGAITDTSPGQGIRLENNTGATLAFSGGLTLSTASNPAFTATGGGTVTVTGASNTATTTTGTALTISNTTIGAAGLTFRSLSSNGAVNGILLNNTGATAGLTVTGTGSAGSGGTIQNSTGIGVSLTSARDVSLAYLNLTGNADDGLNAASVTNLTLNQMTLTNNGNGPTDEGIELDNVWGALTLTNVTVTGSAHNNLALENTSETLTTLSISASSFQSSSPTTGAHGVLVSARGTAAIGAIAITGTTLSSNYSSGVFIDVADTATITDALIQSNTLSGNANGITLAQAGSATFNFRVLSNTLLDAQTHAINVFSSGVATGGALNGRIVSNLIGSAGTPSSGSALGDGIRARIQAQTSSRLWIDGNTIRQTPNGRSITLMGGSTGLDATVTNNDALPQHTGVTPLAAILINSANTTGAINGLIRSDVRGNTVPAGVDSLDGGEYLVLDEDASTTLQLVNTTGAGTAVAQLTATNTGSVSADNVDLIAGPIGLPPQLAATGVGPGADPVTAADLSAAFADAAALWASTDLDAEARAKLAAARLAVSDLPGARLAEADAAAYRITVDATAAGWGWSTGDDVAANRMDARTVLAHELGHLLGHAHTADGLMAEALAAGIRRAPSEQGHEGVNADIVAADAIAAGSLDIVIGTLPAGRSVTIVFDVIISDPVTGGARAVANQAQITATNADPAVSDDPSTPDAGDATRTPLDVIVSLYLPTLLRNDVAQADLSVSVSLSPTQSTFAAGESVTITVVVTNTGRAVAEGFWVDGYLNPSIPPTAANQLWNERCGLDPCYGLAWWVEQPLAPGESLTLTSAPTSTYADNTRWPGHFAPGTTDLYIYVDSYSDDGGAAGGIPERDETNNRAELHGLTVAGQLSSAPPSDLGSALPGR